MICRGSSVSRAACSTHWRVVPNNLVTTCENRQNPIGYENVATKLHFEKYATAFLSELGFVGLKDYRIKTKQSYNLKILKILIQTN